MIRRLVGQRKRFMSGAEAFTVVIHATDLQPLKLNMPAERRAREMAHLLSARSRSEVQVLALPPVHLRCHHVSPLWQVERSAERYLSLRSLLLSAWRNEAWFGDRGHEAALCQLGCKRLLAFATDGAGQGAVQRLPVGSLAPLPWPARFLQGVLINTHFFLFEEAELDSPHVALGDPVGLVAKGGRILLPPVASRSTLLRDEEGWRVVRLGVEDLEVVLPTSKTVHRGSPGVTLYTRGLHLPDGLTPERPDAFEVALVGRWPVSFATGGQLRVPQGGLVLSWGQRPSTEVVGALQTAPVSYRLKDYPMLRHAFQVGPQLLQGGVPMLSDETFEVEGFGGASIALGERAAPTLFPADAHTTLAARVGVGVKRDGELVVLLVQGASAAPGVLKPDEPGCTLHDLAHALLEEGATAALNFDGGGSVQAVVDTQTLLTPADRRGIPGAAFDRPVPLAALVS